MFLGISQAHTNPTTTERDPQKLSREVGNSGSAGRSLGWVEKIGIVINGQQLRPRRIRRGGGRHDGGGGGQAGGGPRRRRGLVVEKGIRRLEGIGVALNRGQKKTGKEKRKLLLQSGLIKSKIDDSLNSVSVPQKHS